MTIINRQMIVPYLAENMYNLVNDVKKYPEFLTWCTNAEILQETDSELIAELVLAYSKYQQRFTTKNTLAAPNKITMNLIDGPFKYLNGVWQFTDITSNGSKVEFQLEFEFENYFMGLAFGKIFKNIAEQMIECFCRRAKEIYG